MKKIAIIGATGYTGSELVRILINHPDVSIDLITSESRKGEKFSDVHPQFLGICDMTLGSIADLETTDVDVVFLALPHGVSMEFVADHHQKDYIIIDLSGDFRLDSQSEYENWYGLTHIFPDGLKNAVYGLPELHKSQIIGSKLIANPGCFPTASILATAPLIQAGIVEASNVIIDAKTGVTGAGIKAKPVTHFPNVNDNFTAYGVTTHRHSIEIQEQLSGQTEHETKVLFTPHLLPVDRGILATAYLKPTTAISQEIIDETYTRCYADAPFVRYRKTLPNLKQVRGTNYCDVYATYDPRTQMIIAMGAIDNLVKGAAGQAVQNMNLCLGLDETKGLNQVPLQP